MFGEIIQMVKCNIWYNGVEVYPKGRKTDTYSRRTEQLASSEKFLLYFVTLHV